MSNVMKNLNASSIALQGKHLIEASAGTGKTHNITRIFLRLLLERALPIEQILVMTFTKDATKKFVAALMILFEKAYITGMT